MNKVLLTGRLTRDPEMRSLACGQERHDVHRGQQRVHRGRQGEVGVPPGRGLGPAGRDRRPLSRQGPAGRHRGPPPDALVGRRQGRSALEDRDRRLARRDAVRAQEEGLRGAAGGRLAGRPGRRARRGRGDRADRRGVVRPRDDRRGRRRGRRRRPRPRAAPRSPPDPIACAHGDGAPPPRRRRPSTALTAGSAARTRRSRR